MTNLRAKEAEKAEQMFKKRKFLDEKSADQQFFDSSDFQSTNKEVDNILRSVEPAQGAKPKAEEKKVNIEEAKWGDDDSLGSLDEELDNAAGAGENAADGEGASDAIESDIFVPPSPGQDPYVAIIRQNPAIVALHAATGDF